MITELDDMYVVLKRNDIMFGLSDTDKALLEGLIEKLEQFRKSIGRSPRRKYVVVSNVLDCYEEVKQIVLDELNETTD